jgi:nitroreductase
MVNTDIISTETATQALSEAAVAAGRAPSIHNTQPWRWRVRHGTADLFAERRRQLRESDLDGRMLTISCGAALHHAQVALAAEGYDVEVVRLPAADDPDHLATITIVGRVAVTADAVRLAQTIEIRHTDRRPLTDQRLSDGAIDALRATAAAHGIGLHMLDRDQVIELASAINRAQESQVADVAASAELNRWSGKRRPSFAGVPDTSIPEHPSQTTVPSRDFGHVGTLPINDGHDAAAQYAILYGLDDDPGTWLRGGEALSALWLAATEHAIAVLPLSAAAESPATRQRLRGVLAGIGYPCIAIRLGIADDQQASPPRTPRMPVSETVEP